MSYAAASGDGLYVAMVRAGELSLYTVEPFAEIARATPPAHAKAITFVGRQVVVYDDTHLTVFSIPRLVQGNTVVLDPPARLLATSHHYALLVRGSELLVATCTSDGGAIAPTRAEASPITYAVGLENAKFMTWPAGRSAEIWDATTRLPTARVALELPHDVCDVGATGKHRSIWIATAGGDLITSRLSDGKTTVAPLPRPPARIGSHPLSAWFVMDFDGEPHAVNSVLRSWQKLAIPAERPRVLAPSVGSHAYVIVDDGTHVTRHDVGADGVAKSVSVEIGAPLPEGDEVAPTAPPRPVQRVQGVRTEIEDPEPEPRTAATRFGQREKEPARFRPFARAPQAARDWRAALTQWSTELATNATTALPAVSSPPSTLADRAKLDEPARRILFALYADWLAGHGDVGIAASRLVEIAGQTAWEEALGNGQLGKLGFVASQLGRCALARAVGTFLDGHEPEVAKRFDGIGRAPEAGSYRVKLRNNEAREQCAARVAHRVGVIAFGESEAARVEAWLREWPYVTATPPEELRANEVVIAIVDDGPADY